MREGRIDAKEKVKTVIISFLLSEIRGKKRRYVVMQETETRRTEGREKEEKKTRDGAEMRRYV